jgi:hypothetical protein
VRVIDRECRIGNDAAFSMNDVWAAKSANSFLRLSQGLDAFLQANALVIR